MNTYFWTVALGTCFLALGGFGDEPPMEDLCRLGITDANLGKELDRLGTNINVLDLCDNQLRRIDRDSFRNFDLLEELIFDGNSDLGFPPDGSPFIVVESLTKLQCIKCGVEKIFNRSLQNLPKIERINLTSNRITEIERLAFQANSELQMIDLRLNKLERLPNEMIEGLKKLELLDLSFNTKLNVQGDKPFLFSNYLKELKCEGCGFTVIYKQTFAKLTALQKLDLRANSIKQLQSDAFHLLTNLHNNDQLKLCLRDENIDQLLCETQKIKSWKNFHCPNETFTEVDCTQFTEPPTTPTTIQTETSSLTSSESTAVTVKTTETATTTITEVSKTTTHKPPAEPTIGISDWYISSYLTIIILTQILALVILVGVWLKIKKYDSDPELDSLAGTILNPNTCYKPLY